MQWKTWQCKEKKKGRHSSNCLITLIKQDSYGYVTNTRVKIIAVVSVTDGIIRDADMKSVR